MTDAVDAPDNGWGATFSLTGTRKSVNSSQTLRNLRLGCSLLGASPFEPDTSNVFASALPEADNPPSPFAVSQGQRRFQLSGSGQWSLTAGMGVFA